MRRGITHGRSQIVDDHRLGEMAQRGKLFLGSAEQSQAAHFCLISGSSTR
jgi:hypothetical protein